MAKIVPELNYLLAEVEKRYGRRLSTSADFEALSVVVEHESGELISASTLKRLWGYVTLKPTPRISTLNVLSRYIGKRDFNAFQQSIMSDGHCVQLLLREEGLHIRPEKGSGGTHRLGTQPACHA